MALASSAMPAASLRPQLSRHESSDGEQRNDAYEVNPSKWGRTFSTYAVIEVCAWFPATWLVCWRFQPTVRFVQTAAGKAAVERAGALLQRFLPSWHDSVAKLSANVYSNPKGRTFAEFVLVNKVLAPVSFPTKIWIAHNIVKRRENAAAAAAAAAAPPRVRDPAS